MSYQQSEFGLRPRFVRKLAGRGLSRGVGLAVRGGRAVGKINKSLLKIPKSVSKGQKKLDETGMSMFIPTKKATAAYEAVKRGPKLADVFLGSVILNTRNKKLPYTSTVYLKRWALMITPRGVSPTGLFARCQTRLFGKCTEIMREN